MLASRPVKRITSRQNGLVARFRSARRERRAARRRVVLDGRRVVTESRRAGVRIETLVVSATGLRRDRALRALADACAAGGAEVASATDPVMEMASPLRTASSAVALAPHRPLDPDTVIAPTATGCVFMPIGVQDPGNLGAIVRTAAAAGATGVIVDHGSADPFGWKAVRGAMGCTFRLPVADTDDVGGTLAQARRRRWTVVTAVPRGGTPLDAVDWRRPVVVMMGNEGAGLDVRHDRNVDAAVSIPMADGVESLNVAVAAAILAYEIRRHRTTA